MCEWFVQCWQTMNFWREERKKDNQNLQSKITLGESKTKTKEKEYFHEGDLINLGKLQSKQRFIYLTENFGIIKISFVLLSIIQKSKKEVCDRKTKNSQKNVKIREKKIVKQLKNQCDRQQKCNTIA